MAARTTLGPGEKANGICLGQCWTALPTSGDNNTLVILLAPAILRNLAHPERFELPTARFVAVSVEIQTNRNSKLDGPPSSYVPPSAAETLPFSP